MKIRPLVVSTVNARSIESRKKTQIRIPVNGRKSCPLGVIGDQLWIKEPWAGVNTEFGPGIAYKRDEFWQPEYDGEDFGGGPSFNYEKYPGDYSMWYEDLLNKIPCHKWNAAKTMPRWASRITIEVINTRIQLIQEIDSSEALAEGISQTKFWTPAEVDENPKPIHEWKEPYWDDFYFWTHYPERAFKNYWIKNKGAQSWERNIPVWVVEFQLIENTPNI